MLNPCYKNTPPRSGGLLLLSFFEFHSTNVWISKLLGFKTGGLPELVPLNLPVEKLKGADSYGAI